MCFEMKERSHNCSVWKKEELTERLAHVRHDWISFLIGGICNAATVPRYPDPKNSSLGPQKVKTTPKSSQNKTIRNEGNIEKNFFSTAWIDWKTIFEPYPNSKNSPSGPQKFKNDPKIKPNSNVRIEGIIKNESHLFTQVDPKPIFEPIPTLKTAY